MSIHHGGCQMLLKTYVIKTQNRIPTYTTLVQKSGNSIRISTMSGGKVPFRDIGPFLQAVRNVLLGRKHTNALRFEPQVSARTQPQPQIPDGVAHKHAHNYYYTRDGRREVAPPVDVTKKLLAAESADGAPKQAANVMPTPGKIFHWDKHYE